MKPQTDSEAFRLLRRGFPASPLSDRVAVIGASGNVGKLLALRLAESFEVVGVARDPSRVRGFLPEDKVKLVAAELTDPASLEKALEGAAACVICTGTTP